MITLGVFLMIVAIAVVVGSCCGLTWLLCFYLFVKFFLILVVLCFTIFAFVVTSKGSRETIPGRAYKEYRLEAYSDWLQKRVNSDWLQKRVNSDWLQKRVNNAKHWNNIRSCLYKGKLCTRLENFPRNKTTSAFNKENLIALESSCCKPSNDCNLGTYKNSDCQLWDSGNEKLICCNCQACKAGFLDSLKSSWKIVSIFNIVFLVFLTIVYAMGCYAFRNNKREDSYARFNGF